MMRYLIIILGAIGFELLAMYAPDMHLPMGLSLAFGIGAGVLLLVALWEKPKADERDNYVTWKSSHIAFLAVATLLAGVLAYQTILHQVDPWIVVAVATLIIGKFVGRWSAERRTHQ